MEALAAARAKIAGDKLRDEDAVVEDLLSDCRLARPALKAIEETAVRIVEGTRARRAQKPLLDSFLHEYGLSSQEGVALMCLAEALLRVPDAQTRDDLISDKIAPGAWVEHAGKADTLFVNASTWGLMLTGGIVRLDPGLTGSPGTWLGRLSNRIGEPMIRTAMVQAMRILGSEFVLGQTIKDAIARGQRSFGRDQLFSFDMLGEGARTFADAQRHMAAYETAIREVGKLGAGRPMAARSGVSVKLSALHPRYEPLKRSTIVGELGERLAHLAALAAEADIGLSVDAEEADRLDLSLDLFERVARCAPAHGWEGFGFVVQAYGKRAPGVLDWLGALAQETGRRFMVRLVKGAYWDTEIKHAQAMGLKDYPIFTRKASTDLSYLVCAERLMAYKDRLFAQFATHNAHTIAEVLHLARGDIARIELQRLHGMGELVYDVVKETGVPLPQVRVYAPVGGHKDLLAYLVRRLLENGANSSFVNRFMDAEIPAMDVVRDPVSAVRAQEPHRHPAIVLPADIYGTGRRNSAGFDLSDRREIDAFSAAVSAPRRPIASADEGMAVVNPANLDDRLGMLSQADPREIDTAFAHAVAAQPAWDAAGGVARAKCLIRAADIMEERRLALFALIVREAGKTYADAVAEVREAVDFLRYYGAQAAAQFERATRLPGITGERNELSLHGRGVFVAIAPWNFPLAIFVGQIAAALGAGNAVLAKPAEQTPLIAAEAVRILHEAGVPGSVLAFVQGGGETGAALVADARTSGVAFTGSVPVAHAIHRSLAAKPGPIVPLIAETGGQNVMFVDSTALLEQVCDAVLQSAFYSAGQRCSALRVLYLQSEIADQAIAMICGAMDALMVGDPADPATDVGPIIDADARDGLQRHIDAMKSAALKFHQAPLTPACARGTYLAPTLIEIESIRQLTKEQFGPILHVIRYKSSRLKAVLAEAFSTGYGLTLGVHTRMDQRWREIFAAAPVGNTYINRNMVGAVVGSQPFGGLGLSGTGFKAGGPHYMLRFAAEKSLSVNTMASGGNTELLTVIS